MYSWIDRADYHPPQRWLYERVDREAYSDGVMHWTPKSQDRGRSARMSRTTAYAAAIHGPIASAPSGASQKVASGAVGTAPSPRTTCGPKSRPSTRISSVGEQADYELDRLFAGHWSDDWWDDALYQVAQPLRAGVKAPELVPADPMDFPLVDTP